MLSTSDNALTKSVRNNKINSRNLKKHRNCGDVQVNIPNLFQSSLIKLTVVILMRVTDVSYLHSSEPLFHLLRFVFVFTQRFILP